MKFLLFCCYMFIVLQHCGYAYTNEELLTIAKTAWKDRMEAGGWKDSEESTFVFRKHFKGIDDAERIRAFFLYLVDVDSEGGKMAMSGYTPMRFWSILRNDPTFVEDWNSLADLLRKESRPREFYLLSCMAPPLEMYKENDFIYESVHMLWSSGRFAKGEGERTVPWANDVSNFTYEVIASRLEKLQSSFSPPPHTIPLNERKVILVNWLKENWPRCENIEIPSQFSKEQPRPRKPLVENEKNPSRSTDEREQKTLQGAEDQSKENRLPWIIAGCLLVGIIALAFKMFMGRST